MYHVEHVPGGSIMQLSNPELRKQFVALRPDNGYRIYDIQRNQLFNVKLLG